MWAWGWGILHIINYTGIFHSPWANDLCESNFYPQLRSRPPLRHMPGKYWPIFYRLHAITAQPSRRWAKRTIENYRIYGPFGTVPGCSLARWSGNKNIDRPSDWALHQTIVPHRNGFAFGKCAKKKRDAGGGRVKLPAPPPNTNISLQNLSVQINTCNGRATRVDAYRAQSEHIRAEAATKNCHENCLSE